MSVDLVVADGATVSLRAVRPGDADDLERFLGRLSPAAQQVWSLTTKPSARKLARIDTHDLDRVVQVVQLAEQVIAVGFVRRLDHPAQAEVALVVDDVHRGRGIASLLLEHLVLAARDRDIDHFVSDVPAGRASLLSVFTDAGHQAVTSIHGDVVHLSFDLTQTAATEAVRLERELAAEAASIRRLTSPRSVAVIGASPDPGKIGNAVLRNLVAADFRGRIHPINPTADEIEGLPAYASILDVPGPVDLAVITVPADAVPPLMAMCAQMGVRGLVVISGGFGEQSADRAAGLAAQRALAHDARAYGMRIIGPNCLGIANNDPDVRLNASLAPLVPPLGRTAFFSQSGALGVAVLGEAVRRHVGLSTFVSAGNRADVSGNDMLQYWDQDPATDVILLYLESFGNPRKFARLTRRVARSKPIVAVKSGHGQVVSGLQGTTVDVPERSIAALFEASGVIRVRTLDEMFDVALLLAAQPLPGGNRVAVVGNSAALNMLVAAACDEQNLELTVSVDVGVNAGSDEFAAALGDAIGSPDVDALVAVFVPPLLAGDGAEYGRALRTAVAGSGKPVLSTFLGFEGVPVELASAGDVVPAPGSIPTYPSPERAVRTLSRAVRHAAWRRRDAGVLVEFDDVEAAPARQLADHILATSAGGRDLNDAEVELLLRAYGLPVVPSREVVGPWEAQSAAVTIGWPVALRLVESMDLEPSVRLHLHDEHALADAWASLGLAEDGRAIVQAMAPRGVDTVFGIQDDGSFGALVSFGIGGVATELLGDRGYAVVPLTDADAAELVGSPRAAPMLTGYAGAPPADLDALAQVALRLSRMSDDLPEIARLTLGVVVASPVGAHVLRAQITVAPPPGRSDGARSLHGY